MELSYRPLTMARLQIIICLAVSLSCGFFMDSDFAIEVIYPVSSRLYYSISALLFLLCSAFCSKYVINEKLTISTRYVCFALCSCMIVTSWLNVLFCSKDMYVFLIEFRQMAWSKLYRYIEILSLTTWIICNGKYYINTISGVARELRCRCWGYNVIINHVEVAGKSKCQIQR